MTKRTYKSRSYAELVLPKRGDLIRNPTGGFINIVLKVVEKPVDKYGWNALEIHSLRYYVVRSGTRNIERVHNTRVRPFDFNYKLDDKGKLYSYNNWAVVDVYEILDDAEERSAALIELDATATYWKTQESDADPGSMDGDAQSALASAGWGTDEDYQPNTGESFD